MRLFPRRRNVRKSIIEFSLKHRFESIQRFIKQISVKKWSFQGSDGKHSLILTLKLNTAMMDDRSLDDFPFIKDHIKYCVR